MVKHLLKTAIDAIVKNSAIRQYDKFLCAGRINNHRPLLALKLDDRPPCGLQDLKRSDNPLSIPNFQSIGHRCIFLRQLRVKRLRPFMLQPQPNLATYLLGNFRHVRKTTGQRLEVETSATDEDRQLTASANVWQKRGHVTQPFSCRISLCRSDMTIEMMSYSLHLIVQWPCGQHP
ncbi:hypothetical protein D3C87_1670000 [compost metagenome]